MNPPSDPSILVALAEVSIALAGFSAIVVLFRRRESGTWLAADADRFHGMIIHAMAATFFCLLPSVVAVFVSRSTAVWGITSGLLCLQILAHVALVMRFASTGRGSRGALMLGVVAAGLLGLNAAGVVYEREFGPYLVGVLWHLLQSSVLFVWLIWIPASQIEEA